MPFRITLPLVVVVGFVLIGLSAGGGNSVGDPNVIRIVSSMPRSGSARGQTDAIANGIRLALDEVDYTLQVTDPESHEQHTFHLEYRDLDDATAAAGQWTIEQEIANANQARNDPDVTAYIGTYNSGAAKVSMPILNRAHIVMVSPANTAESLTKPNTGERHEPQCYRPSGTINFFRVVPTDELQSELAARWIHDLGAQRIYILDDNEYYGKGIAAGLRENCRKLGITVIASESIDTKGQEFVPLMFKIKETNPDLVYFAGTTQGKAGQLLKDMIKVKLLVPMMAPDGCYEQAMIASAGADAFEKIPFYVTFGGLTVSGLKAGGGRGAEFVQRYAAKYGHEPTEGYAVYGYECGLAVLEAIRIAGKKDREAIRLATTKIRNLSGATGIWSFDENGDTTNQTMSGVTVKNGEFVFVKLLKRPTQ